jgi:hypothetical protein
LGRGFSERTTGWLPGGLGAGRVGRVFCVRMGELWLAPLLVVVVGAGAGAGLGVGAGVVTVKVGEGEVEARRGPGLLGGDRLPELERGEGEGGELGGGRGAGWDLGRRPSGTRDHLAVDEDPTISGSLGC